MKVIFPILFFILLNLSGFSQTRTAHEIDISLTASYKNAVANAYKPGSDSAAKIFNDAMLEKLENPLTFNNKLDSLSKYIKIITSADKKVKFYSWDAKDGGTWHDIRSIAQFISESGKVTVQQLDSDTGEFSYASIYQIYPLEIRGRMFYLTLAWGTNGGGNQFQVVRLYYIAGEELKRYTLCFRGNKDLALEYPRSENLSLKFDPKTNELSYSEFKIDDAVGIYRSTGKKITLHLVNGIFL